MGGWWLERGVGVGADISYYWVSMRFDELLKIIHCESCLFFCFITSNALISRHAKEGIHSHRVAKRERERKQTLVLCFVS